MIRASILHFRFDSIALNDNPIGYFRIALENQSQSFDKRYEGRFAGTRYVAQFKNR